MSEEIKRLKEAAIELNKMFGLDPPINTALEEEALTEALKKGGSFAAIDDDLSASTWEILVEFQCLKPEIQKIKEEEMAKKKVTKTSAKKNSTKAPTSEKKEVVKKDKYCREYSVIDAIKESKKALTVEELGTNANAIYRKNGGDDNLKQSIHVTRIGLKYLRHLGTITINEDGKIVKE